jgi:hypothetical protein
VADFLPHMSDDARAELLDLLVGRDTPGLLIPQGLARTVEEVRRAPDGWLQQRTISGQWTGQWLLSMQACALMFTARVRYDARDRWWFFRLAAEAAGAYLGPADAYEPGEVKFVPGPREAEPTVVEAVVAAVKLPEQVARPEAKPETKAEAKPAPGPVRIPAPTPARESAAPSPEAAGESRPDAAPETPTRELPDTLPALLIDLHGTFGDRLGELREHEAGSVTARTLGLIREQADRGQGDLKALLTSRHDTLGEEARDRLDTVLGRLARVIEAANEPGLSYEQPLFVRDLAHRMLVAALDQLLGSAREAALGLEAGEAGRAGGADGAGQATDPIRPEGARTASG